MLGAAYPLPVQLKDPSERWDEIIKPGHTRPGRPLRRSRLRKGLKYLLALLMVVAVIGAGSYAYLQVKLKANSTKIPELTSPVPDQTMNVLVVGSDDRSVLPADEIAKFDPTGTDRKTGRRADTIMLIHLDEKREKAVILSFPRDLRVKYPSGRTGKINGTYQQGPGALVDTVESFSNLPVHHYVEVNFVGFRNIVDALGGVQVYFERKIAEPDSGLYVSPGCVRLKGDQALAFVRVRKIDDDFGRIARQQLFISLLMDKVTSAGTLFNVPKLLKLVNLFAENVTTDAGLSVNDVRKIAFRLRSFDPKRVDMRVVPSSSTRIGGVSYVVHNQRQTNALLSAIRERRPLPDFGRTGVNPIDAADIRVQALNGTAVKGLAAKGAAELEAKGYEVIEPPADADNKDYAKTIVYFKEGHEEKAAFVAAAYGAAVKPLPAAIFTQADVAIVFGADYADGRATPAPAPSPTRAKPAPKPLVHRC